MLVHKGQPLLGAEDHRMDVAAWLRGLGLDQYAPVFRDNDVDGEVLPELTADDLISIGVTSVGHRRKLLAAIAALGTQPPTVAQPAASASSAPSSPPTIEAERRPGRAPPRAIDWFAKSNAANKAAPSDRAAFTKGDPVVMGQKSARLVPDVYVRPSWRRTPQSVSLLRHYFNLPSAGGLLFENGWGLIGPNLLSRLAPRIAVMGVAGCGTGAASRRDDAYRGASRDPTDHRRLPAVA
jgi:hypothetical protein